MKHSDCNRDLTVFDFKEEEELPDNRSQWSKLSNPKSEDPLTKYQFLQYASAASIAQIKEVRSMDHVHVVAIEDDDDNGFISDITNSPLDLLESVGSKRSEGFDFISGRPFQQQCHFLEDSIDTKNFSSGMDIQVSCHFRSSSGDGPVCSTIPQSPSSNDSADAGTSDGHGSIQQSSPSTPASPMDENDVPRDLHTEYQSVDGLEMGEMDTVVVNTDYVIYCDNYFPALCILITKNFIRMKASDKKELSGLLRSEWDISDVACIESHWCSVASIAKVKLSLLPYGAVRAENAQNMSEVEDLEFVVHDPDWPQRQQWIMSLDKRYKAAWSFGNNGKSCDEDAFSMENSDCCSDPYIPIFEEPFEEVVYPKGDVDAVSISKRDVDLLQPEIFINDTIIDFYTKYLKNRISHEERTRFHFFNSFFFRKLADLDKNSSSAFDSKAAFQRVRKWTRKVNLFEKDYIFIPVNYNLHWSLIVICHPGEVANFSDESIDESLKVPCILHMDSIRGSHTGLKDIIQSYLLEEWKERRKEDSEDIHSKFLNLRFLSLELPQQENCSDCGLFLLHYTELFIAEAPENFSPFTINKFDNFLKPDWFIPAEASIKRVHIQRLIYSLLESNSGGSSPSCSHESLPQAVPENNENDNGIEIISEKRSPGKQWNGNLSFSQSIQGMEMCFLDVPLYRNSQCINETGSGMRDLLDRCQQFDQAASFGQLGSALSSIKEEEEEAKTLACSTLGQDGFQPLDVPCHIGFSSGEFREGIAWNTELSDQADPEGKSSPKSNHSFDDSEEMRIIEGDPERPGACSDANEYMGQPEENMCPSKENMDSLTESYASAASDMMENPVEDSQEMHKIYGSNGQEEPLSSNPEKEGNNDEKNRVFDEKMVVQDSSSDSDVEQVVKKRRIATPIDEERGLV